MTDEKWMRVALAQARRGALRGEVPVGAVVVRDNKILGVGFNRPIENRDPTAHAEVQALRDAAKFNDNYRLNGATLYVTLEPCGMCAGAIVHSRIERVVFGSTEPKAGVCGSRDMIFDSAWVNHRPQLEGGVLAAECGKVLKDFFVMRRAQQKQAKQDARLLADHTAAILADSDT